MAATAVNKSTRRYKKLISLRALRFSYLDFFLTHFVLKCIQQRGPDMFTYLRFKRKYPDTEKYFKIINTCWPEERILSVGLFVICATKEQFKQKFNNFLIISIGYFSNKRS
jgi:hypothetical protein